VQSHNHLLNKAIIEVNMQHSLNFKAITPGLLALSYRPSLIKYGPKTSNHQVKRTLMFAIYSKTKKIKAM
jgi:hypothetical protein